MAISANTTWEVRTTGSDNNGGGFVAGASGTDYSQQDSAQYTFTDLAVDATTNTKVTSAGHSFVSADVGNILHVTSGTGWTAGFYQIVSVASGAATLDRSPAATSTTGGTYAVGGALATVQKADSALIAGNAVWVKAGTYNFASSFSFTGGSGGSPITWMGYTSSRGDNGKATLTATANTGGWVFSLGNGYVRAFNFIFNGASVAGNFGVLLNGIATLLYNCITKDFPNRGFQISGNSAVNNVEVSGCGASSGYAVQMYSGLAQSVTVHNCAAVGIYAAGGHLMNCIVYGNTGTGSHGFYIDDATPVLLNCVADNNAGDGFFIASNRNTCVIRNSIATRNGGYGINNTTALPSLSSTAIPAFDYNAFYSNTSGARNNLAAGANDVILTALPYAGSGDFAPNNTAGAGAAIRSVGFPGVLVAGGTGYADIGALRHQDPSASPLGFLGSPNISPL